MTTMLAPEMRRQETARKGTYIHQAYDLIRNRILSGDLPLGALIPRRDLAREFGMSLQPISDALQRLEHDGLVESISRVGTRVRIPKPQDIRGFYIVREALESQAARLFAERASNDQRRELEQMAQELDAEYEKCVGFEQVSAQRLHALRRQHMMFHKAIAERTGCPFLSDTIEKNQVLIFNYLWDELFGRAGLPPRWHVDLVAELAAGDVEGADRAMRRHVLQAGYQHHARWRLAPGNLLALPSMTKSRGLGGGDDTPSSGESFSSGK
jgi:DNA-binding GntR family transcriptional regulator